MNPYRDSIKILSSSGAGFIVIGGLAVVMHGVNRFTPDLNLIVDFNDTRLATLIEDLRTNGYRFSTEDAAEILFDDKKRSEYSHGSRKLFLGMYGMDAPTFGIDFFLQPPVDFSTLKENAEVIETSDGLQFLIPEFSTLIEMKKSSERGQDKIDVENLECIQEFKEVVSDPKRKRAFLKTLSGSNKAERIENLVRFYLLSPDQKLDWLGEMQANLGQFM